MNILLTIYRANKLLVHKIGFTIVSIVYSTIQKWNVMNSLHLDMLNYEFCTYNNK
jgi:hypothetical protein